MLVDNRRLMSSRIWGQKLLTWVFSRARCPTGTGYTICDWRTEPSLGTTVSPTTLSSTTSDWGGSTYTTRTTGPVEYTSTISGLRRSFTPAPTFSLSSTISARDLGYITPPIPVGGSTTSGPASGFSAHQAEIDFQLASNQWRMSQKLLPYLSAPSCRRLETCLPIGSAKCHFGNCTLSPPRSLARRPPSKWDCPSQVDIPKESIRAFEQSYVRDR